MLVDNHPHMHTGAGMMRLGQKEFNQPSLGLGWHAQIVASLSMKGPGSGVARGMVVDECAVEHMSQMLVEYISSEC